MIDDTLILNARYRCRKCGDLDYLCDDELCRNCQPQEKVIGFEELCAWAMNGARREPRTRWRVG